VTVLSLQFSRELIEKEQEEGEKVSAKDTRHGFRATSSAADVSAIIIAATPNLQMSFGAIVLIMV
jgi:hypothetical protein